MKRLIAFTLLPIVFFASSARAAAKWQKAARTDTETIFLDSNYVICSFCSDRPTVYLQRVKTVPSSVSRYRTHLRSIYESLSYGWIKTASYSLDQFAFDCSSGESTYTGRGTNHDSRGRTVKSFVQKPYGDWTFEMDVPDSVGSTLFELACNI